MAFLGHIGWRLADIVSLTRPRPLPRLLEPAVVTPAAGLAEKRGVDAVPRNLLNRLIALWTTYDRSHT
jgi:hypothetical protein